MSILLALTNGANAVVNISSFSLHFPAKGAVEFNISALASMRLTKNIAKTYTANEVMAYTVYLEMGLTTAPLEMPEMWKQGMPDDKGLCGGFLVWLTKEKKEWLSGRYISSTWDVEELEEMKEEILKGDKLKMKMVV